jgi:DHA1 family bicyclomycin/chloramphenicol resistance-like MFS transporter
LSAHGANSVTSAGRQTAILAGLATVGQFSTSVYVPSIPSMAADLAAPVAALQLTIAAYLEPIAFGQLVMGALADRWGRRRVLTGGMLLFLSGTAVCLFAIGAAPFFAGRALQGLGAAAGLVVSRAVARDLFEGDALVRAVSAIAIAFALVPGVAPLFGGLIEDALGWRAAFVATLLLGLALMLAYLAIIPESLRRSEPPSTRQLLQGYRSIFFDRAFQRHAIVSAGPIAGIFAFLAGGPVFAIKELGMSASAFGIYPPLATTGFLVFNRLAMHRLPTLGPVRLVAIGLLLAAMGSTIALVLRATGTLEINGLTFAMWLFSGGMGVVVPLSTAQAMQLHPDRAGSAAAVIGFEQMAGGVLGTVGVAALAPSLGSAGFPMTMALACFATAMIFVVVNRRGPKGRAVREV